MTTLLLLSFWQPGVKEVHTIQIIFEIWTNWQKKTQYCSVTICCCVPKCFLCVLASCDDVTAGMPVQVNLDLHYYGKNDCYVNTCACLWTLIKAVRSCHSSIYLVCSSCTLSGLCAFDLCYRHYPTRTLHRSSRRLSSQLSVGARLKKCLLFLAMS